MLFLLAGVALAQAPERVFRGSIILDKEPLPIRMYLKVSGQKASGYYVYEGKEKPLRVEGTLNESGLSLKEYDGARQTGVFKGGYTDVGIEGDWYIPSGKMGGTFSIVENDVAFSKAHLSTVYIRDKPRDIRVLYPQFSGTGSGWQTLNAMLRKEATGMLTDIQQAPAERGRPAGYLDMDYRIWLGRDRFVSLTITAGYYYPGAAHPGSYVNGYNVDPQTGKDIPLSSLFKKGSNYLGRLVEVAKRNLEGQLQTQGMSQEDRQTTLDELQVEGLEWSATPGGLWLYFGVPHVLGDTLEVFVGFEDLKDVLETSNTSPLGLAGIKIK